MKYIKVLSIPGRVADVEVEDNSNIDACVRQAGMSLEGMNITCTDPAKGATATTVPANGAQIVLTREVKGA